MLAIVNAKIRPIQPLEYIANGFVLIEDDKIVSIGDMAHFSKPENSRLIDAEQAWLLPGFIDSHCHLGLDEIGGRGSHCNEIGSPYTPLMNALDAIVPDEEYIFRAHQLAGITTVLASPGSANVFGGLAVAIKTIPSGDVESMVLKNPCLMKMAVGENPARVYGSNGKSPSTKMGVAALIREKFVQAQVYRRKKVAHFSNADKKPEDFDIKPDLELLVDILDGKLPVQMHAHNAEDMMTSIRLQREFGFKMHFTHGTEAFKIIPQLKKYGVGVSFSPMLSVASKNENIYRNRRVLKSMSDHNIPFAISTDFPVHPIELLPIDAGFAIKEGLTLWQAERSITTQAADLLELSARIGSIEPGKDADLVFWNEHPLLSLQAEPQLVLINGQVVFDGHIDPRQHQHYLQAWDGLI